jgi:hypothetical protein
MASLTKIVDETPREISSGEQVVTCPLCEQTYMLRYGEVERHHLTAWLRKADIAMLKEHTHDRHKRATLKLDW